MDKPWEAVEEAALKLAKVAYDTIYNAMKDHTALDDATLKLFCQRQAIQFTMSEVKRMFEEGTDASN